MSGYVEGGSGEEAAGGEDTEAGRVTGVGEHLPDPDG
jgi:hypothetical protein